MLPLSIYYMYVCAYNTPEKYIHTLHIYNSYAMQSALKYILFYRFDYRIRKLTLITFEYVYTSTLENKRAGQGRPKEKDRDKEAESRIKKQLFTHTYIQSN